MSNVTCVYGPQPPGMTRGRCHYGRGTIGVLGSAVPSTGVDGPGLPRAAMTVDNAKRYRVVPVYVPVQLALDLSEDGRAIGVAGVSGAYNVQLSIIEDGVAL